MSRQNSSLLWAQMQNKCSLQQGQWLLLLRCRRCCQWKSTSEMLQEDRNFQHTCRIWLLYVEGESWKRSHSDSNKGNWCRQSGWTSHRHSQYAVNMEVSTEVNASFVILFLVFFFNRNLLIITCLLSSWDWREISIYIKIHPVIWHVFNNTERIIQKCLCLV